jgi:hypothetical protein
VQQKVQLTYNLVDFAIDWTLKNLIRLLKFIPAKKEILLELKRRKITYPTSYDVLEATEYLLENNKIDINLYEIYKNHSKEIMEMIPHSELVQIASLVSAFAVAKKSKILDCLTFEQFRQEVLKSKYAKYAIKYPEILRRIYNFFVLYLK